ncbi:MAG TPA: large-conductance mechanosensitive channel protein MscL [Chloroflexi bacterium]|nr:large-conductance mechanosensitive channel protein MscL [Chloroflexota bacterium]
MKKFFEEFKAFAVKGNVVDLAIAVVMGGAFGTIVNSLVTDIIMPPIGLLLGGVDFSNLFLIIKAGDPAAPYASLADAQAAGAVSLNYGVFLSNIITFLIVAFAMFLIIKGMNKLNKKGEETPAPAPTTKKCPFCFTEIPIEATRCPNCTSQLD